MSESAYQQVLSDFAQKHDCELTHAHDESSLTTSADNVTSVCTALKNDHDLLFEQLIDIAGIDYLEYGKTEWKTKQATGSGFSRGVSENTFGRFTFDDNKIQPDMDSPRFAAVYQLLSITRNRRLRLKAICQDNQFPRVPSVCSIWASANWFEREAFDLYGIVFDGHPDLRRLLTDYGFVGHPLRKDFPLVGHVEVRYDPSQERVIYEPVSIEPRVLVPKVIRHDHRYEDLDEQ